MEKQLAGSTKKFLFDLNDFDEEAIRRAEAAARRPTFSQAEMEASRQTGYEEGRVEGLKEAIGSQEAQIRDLMQQIVTAADRMKQDEADRMATFIDQAALIAVQALSKSLPVLLEHLAVQQIAAFITGVLEEQTKGQTLTIYVPAAHEDAVRERLSGHAATMKRAETWAIAADPTLTKLQCRIEWSGGGADWDPGQVADRLLDTITAHLPEDLRPHAVIETTTAEAPTQTQAAETPAAEVQQAVVEPAETKENPPAMDADDQTPHTDATTSGDES